VFVREEEGGEESYTAQKDCKVSLLYGHGYCKFLVSHF